MLNQTDAGAVPRRIHHAFLPWAESQPEAIALSDDLITRPLWRVPVAVDAVAAQMSAAGVRPGDRVLLVAENAVALAVCIMALSQLDAWSATVNARLSAREIDNFLDIPAPASRYISAPCRQRPKRMRWHAAPSSKCGPPSAQIVHGAAEHPGRTRAGVMPIRRASRRSWSIPPARPVRPRR